MQVIWSPGQVATASANIVRALLRRVHAALWSDRARPSAAAGRTGDPGMGTNPDRRFPSGPSRALARRRP